MSSIPEEFSIKLGGQHPASQHLSAMPAANADRLGDPAPEALTETSTGWDSYDVWRRLIKDARNRRRADHP